MMDENIYKTLGVRMFWAVISFRRPAYVRLSVSFLEETGRKMIAAPIRNQRCFFGMSRHSVFVPGGESAIPAARS